MTIHDAGPGLRRAVLAAAIAVSPGCRLQQPPLALDGAKDVPTARADAVVSCDTDNARWSFALTTTGWSGGGEVLMSRDGSYLEVHRLPSVEAAEDGSADRLELELTVVADWRDVETGSTTIFNCHEPGLAGMARVFARDGEAVAGCAAFGLDPSIWQTWRTDYTCDDVVPLEGDTEETGDTGDTG